ncbi:MAG: OmpH family outer membrane protein [Planctomycetaceae bacterium]|nr:OmpH family outer membrane protein [Planctomycetaceae bacterium]
MKKSVFWAMLAAVLSLGVYYSIGVAQGPAPGQGTFPPAAPTSAPPATRVALVDITHIIKNHQRFRATMEELKAQVKQAEQQVNNERQEIARLARQLQDLQKGSPDYKNLEEQIRDRDDKLTLGMNRQKTTFLKQEAKNYHNAYQEVCQAVDFVSQQYGIDLVLRFNREPMNPESPESVLAGINQMVVRHRGLDITDRVLEEVNRGGTPPNGGAATRPATPFTAPR